MCINWTVYRGGLESSNDLAKCYCWLDVHKTAAPDTRYIVGSTRLAVYEGVT
jgi:hypothetical protein